MSTQTDTQPSELVSDHEGNRDTRLHHEERPASILISLWNYAVMGAAGALLLAVIELVDLNIKLSPVFQSPGERLVFGVFFSLNVAGGLVIGLLVGLVVHAASFLKRTIQKVISLGDEATSVQSILAGISVCATVAFLLNQQPQIHGHAIAIIREAEKFESLTTLLLNHERSTSYLLLMAVVAGGSLLWMANRRLSLSGAALRVAWIVLLLLVVGVVYYVDSTFETPLFEASVHRSLFLLNTGLSLSLAAAILSRKGVHRRLGTQRSLPIGAILVVFVLAALVAFTFVRFDKNQNLKTQLFLRTSQAKQYFKFAQWALDFDRDGYSYLLGGGDSDDRRADVNPSRGEIIGDGIDHNCIGGALSDQGVADWRFEHASLNIPVERSAKHLNVIYVFIDALRADHLSAYGYTRKTSPNLDKLAARSALFENAFTPAPNTFEALPKFTQGTYWDAHLDGWPEIMARNGYNALLFPRRITTLRRHVKGMKVVDTIREHTFEGTIDAAIELLGSTSKEAPFCAYLYSTDTHRPYKTHEQFNYGSSMVDLYDGEISYLDFHLGRLFNWMEQSGRMDDTIIVIMADHGESLGERGVYKHSTQLYNEQVRIPMIIHLPGSRARTISEYVSTIDLGPTILNAAGLEYPKECAGVSLVPLMRGQPFTHPPIYGEQTTQETSPYVRPDQYVSPEQKKYMLITQDGFKLIFNRDIYSFELFDLRNDPAEVRNLYDQLPDKAAYMKSRLGRFIDVLTVSRPWDADESQYFFGPTGEVREAK